MQLRLHRYLPFTNSEGPGKRACIWVQGCSIHCDGCGVPWTWSTTGGTLIHIEDLFQQILESKAENQIEGVTFLGGEPFDQATPLVELAYKLKGQGLSIMTFSGYTFETILNSNRQDWADLLTVTDLLIDGPFVKEKLDLSRPWVGSLNQNYRFLTDRYAHLEKSLLDIPNRLEIRIEKNGQILVNGMAAPSTLKELLEKLGNNPFMKEKGKKVF
ncbi:ribonucleoside-triphosphate reductase activating protein [Mesobacillus campisalis]|uniref:Ribonucleoside-triphosphate reductase activating protein n=1 Tax=Mesobacillus campisalis TaxID=1408103 RepID=A0A0M2T596_9BACI|nr:4Fe-4S single cluster domain-containing protein [Mesobacillus campisalis]KKK39990.1 ribonucleoside-triphosphate reductase activating protein [Mesobacillus campisalis]